MTPARLDDQMSVMYNLLPNTVAEIDDTADCVSLHVASNESYPSHQDQSEKPAEKSEKEEFVTKQTETRTKTKNPVTNEVTETRRTIIEKTVTTKGPAASKSKSGGKLAGLRLREEPEAEEEITNGNPPSYQE